jgi:hypothetical protein
MKRYTIPIYWEVMGYYEVEANSLEEAKAMTVEMPLPQINDVVMESWELGEDDQIIELDQKELPDLNRKKLV